MDRVLRLLALLSLVAAAVFYVAEKTAPSLYDPGPDTLPFYLLREPLFAQTSLLLAIAVGVVTFMVAAWRGQRAWAIIVLVALLVAADGFIVFWFSLPVTIKFRGFPGLPPYVEHAVFPGYVLRQVLGPVLLPLLALAYTWWPRRAPVSEPARMGSSASPASTRSIATDRTLRLLATLALLISLSVIPFMAYLAAPSTSTPSFVYSAAGQRFLGLWAPMLWETSYLLVFGVGVAALTDAVWRRQRAWIWGLLVTLLVVAYGYILYYYVFYNIVAALPDPTFNGLPDWMWQQYAGAYLRGEPATTPIGTLLGNVIIPGVLALVVLVYTVRPQRRGSGSASSGETTLPQPPTTATGQVEPLT